MTEADFDTCPACGALPRFGIRCHPKFSMKIGASIQLGMVPVYTHSREALFGIYQMMGKPEFVDFEQWNGEVWVTIVPSFSELGEPEPTEARVLDPRLERMPWLTEDDVP